MIHLREEGYNKKNRRSVFSIAKRYPLLREANSEANGLELILLKSCLKGICVVFVENSGIEPLTF